MKLNPFVQLALVAIAASAISLGANPIHRTPALASTAPPTSSPIPVASLSPLPTANPVSSAAAWNYVVSNHSIQSAQALSQCGQTAGQVGGVGMALVSGTTYRVVIVCSNGALLTSLVTF